MAVKQGYLGAFYITKLAYLTAVNAGDFVTVSNPTTSDFDFGSADDFAVEAWMRLDSASAKTRAVAKGASGASGAGWMIGMDTNAAPFFYVRDKASPVSDALMSDTVAARSDSVWHHLVGTRDAGTKCYLYVDGIFAASDAGVTGDLTNASDLIFADRSDGEGMDLGLVRIYNKLLTAAQASDLYSGGFPDTLKGSLMGEWMFSEGEGTNLQDSSPGTAHDGTGTGMAWGTAPYDTRTTEDVGDGDGTTAAFSLDYQNVDYENLTLIISDASSASITQHIGQDFSITPRGTITFTSASIPSSGDNIKASTYRHYPMTLEAGGFTSWSFDMVCDTVDVTDFRSSGWREYKAILKGWTGSAERHWIHPFAKDILNDKCIVKFCVDDAADTYYTAWAIVSGFHPSTAVDTIVDETLDFQGTYMVGTDSV